MMIRKFFKDNEEPVFQEPWEAHAFAMTVHLHARGCFSWTEWSEALAEAVVNQPNEPYYQLWIEALEALLEKKDLLDTDNIRLAMAILCAPDAHSH